MTLTLSETSVFLRENDGYIILTHRRPDGDTVGSAVGLCLGLRAVGKQAFIAKNPEIVGRFERMAGYLAPPDDFSPRTVLAVDTAARSLFPPAFEQMDIDLSIDHHPGDGAYAKMSLLDDGSAATGELVARLLKEMRVELTLDMASALYVAIITDTGCFRFENTTSRTLRTVADLADAGIDMGALNTEYFVTKTPSRFALEAVLLRDVEYIGRIAVAFLTLEKIFDSKASYDDLDGISSLVKTIVGVDIGVTLREEKNGSVKVSVRTVSGYLANGICAKLGGGGHARAAGCLLDCGIDQAREKVLGAIYELYPELLPEG
ncbi:MAG: DHH family phosphoesterase [Oscillospiraceae bacterium]|nr:DHH family phosphoesterase [Oscillospiraceae bacterium]